MKKLAPLSLLITLFFTISACSTMKSSTKATSRSKFTGTWTLKAVTYQGLLEMGIQQVFDEAKPAEFVGSTWKFTNSGNGSYALSNGTVRKIFWSVYNPGNGIAQPMFQFKKLNAGVKAKKVDEGYRLLVADASKTGLILKSPVDLGTQQGFVVFSFVKAP
ncbi:MAG: hypothetical protein ACOH2A_08230 [Sphingobacteriaceae bacterium]